MSFLRLLVFLLLSIRCYSESICNIQVLATSSKCSDRALIHIFKKSIVIKNQYRKPFYFKLAMIKDASSYSYLHFNERFKSKAKEIDFIIENDDDSLDIFHFPLDMSARLIEYLSISPLKGFDCYCFGHFLNSLSYRFSFSPLSKWEECIFDEDLLKTGDSIAIFTIKDGSINEFNHFAIYIGNGLYLSKGGPKGPLVVCDIDIMKSAFGGNQVYLLRRKKNLKLFNVLLDLTYKSIGLFYKSV